MRLHRAMINGRRRLHCLQQLNALLVADKAAIHSLPHLVIHEPVENVQTHHCLANITAWRTIREAILNLLHERAMDDSAAVSVISAVTLLLATIVLVFHIFSTSASAISDILDLSAGIVLFLVLAYRACDASTRSFSLPHFCRALTKPGSATDVRTHRFAIFTPVLPQLLASSHTARSQTRRKSSLRVLSPSCGCAIARRMIASRRIASETTSYFPRLSGSSRMKTATPWSSGCG